MKNFEARERRVLVIDDDELSRALAAEALELEQFRVELAGSGAEGLFRFRSAFPDLVLLDLNMADMDGFECCRWMRQLPEGLLVPILMLILPNDDASSARAFEAGASDFIAKPFSCRLLRRRVRHWLRASAAA